jgi:ATP-binding cassette, subfamily B (MDR/TAP), member 1
MKLTVWGGIAFDRVAFSYPKCPYVQVLKDVSTNIKDGECVAVVGAFGSGKSTVAALLQRLYEPHSGCVTIRSHLLRSTGVTYLREHVSVVSQNPNLFNTNILGNIAYGNSAISDADIQRAAKAANIHDFIMSLPQGYDTMVDENASLISGGQAQRLQIARALARPSKVLILDKCALTLNPTKESSDGDYTAGQSWPHDTHGNTKLPMM